MLSRLVVSEMLATSIAADGAGRLPQYPLSMERNLEVLTDFAVLQMLLLMSQAFEL